MAASFTGQRRERVTRKSVHLTNLLARWTITLGGIGTIVAVLTVCLFLAWVVVPLFRSADIEAPAKLAITFDAPPLRVGVDEYRVLGWALLPGGELRVFRLDSGEVLSKSPLFADRQLSCASFRTGRDDVAYGFSDGTVELGTIEFQTTFLSSDAVPEATRQQLASAPRGSSAGHEDGVLQLTPQGQYRFQRLTTTQGKSYETSGPIRGIVHGAGDEGPLVCVVTGPADAPELLALPTSRQEDFFTGEETLAFTDPVELPRVEVTPDHLVLLGRQLVIAASTGESARISLGDLSAPSLAETARLTPEGVGVTAIVPLLGETTLVWGDTRGDLRAAFLLRNGEFDAEAKLPGARVDPGTEFAFALTKRIPGAGQALVSLEPSTRSRLLAAGYADGTLRLLNVTSEKEVATVAAAQGQPLTQLTFYPKENGLLAVNAQGAIRLEFDPRHPEASLSALFLPVWYEGYPEPTHTWQSSSGHTGFEPKLGLMPLIFGTLKATLYSMLFGAPLALLAAIFTSEYLTPRAKRVVKPTLELMASLPSVVLGFLAALVFAPFVERVLPTALAGVAALPFCFLLGAYLWQIVPQRMTLRLANARGLFMVAPLALTFLLAMGLGPLVEDALFGGDMKAWLAWEAGGAEAYASATGGWMMLTLPVSAVVVALAVSRLVTPRMRALGHLERSQLAALELAKFLVGAIAAILLGLLGAKILDLLGLDPRGSYVDTYVQRNALVVGFVMGFAIIPIIYTIADDALSAVPDHLRSASLGAGATRWQTTVRIVVPTAMSGLFSALMIGLGRAVGETMIVLMAAGNTPVMNWNVFEGFRTLSANIAVELPEAVRDSTHYRTLFLAALVLFAMTFVVNTIAEVVRLRFRKRAVAL